MSDASKHKQQISTVFNSVAGDYDSPALRFFSFTADAMVDYLQPRSDWKVLDVATGTGALAIALAQAVQQGRVMGIDLSEAMLAKAEKNIQKMSLENVDLFEMDAEEPEFHSDYFHAVTCSFGLFFIPDMEKALRQWQRVTRPGGTVLFSSFTDTAFKRLGEIFMEDLKQAGVDVENRPLASARLHHADTCRELMASTGFVNVRQLELQKGYHLKDENEWWDAVWGAAMRGLVMQIPAAERDDFKRRHLEHVAELVGDDGLWMDVGVRLTAGQVPG
jgi:ubiquinone/menaquinone biosynthesis C-methylase UbiE